MGHYASETHSDEESKPTSHITFPFMGCTVTVTGDAATKVASLLTASAKGISENARNTRHSLVTWGVDWASHGERTCCAIIKKHPDGGAEVVAISYAPEDTVGVVLPYQKDRDVTSLNGWINELRLLRDHPQVNQSWLRAALNTIHNNLLWYGAKKGDNSNGR